MRCPSRFAQSWTATFSFWVKLSKKEVEMSWLLESLKMLLILWATCLKKSDNFVCAVLTEQVGDTIRFNSIIESENLSGLVTHRCMVTGLDLQSLYWGLDLILRALCHLTEGGKGLISSPGIILPVIKNFKSIVPPLRTLAKKLRDVWSKKFLSFAKQKPMKGTGLGGQIHPNDPSSRAKNK